MKDLIDILIKTRNLKEEEFAALIRGMSEEDGLYLKENAFRVKQEFYGNKVFTRGLIEFTNYCKNDCYYCGIRKSNTNAVRYRLTFEDIMSCCEQGYELGFRTFVLQGGEDLRFTDEDIEKVCLSIKEKYPDCAITLSIGEKSYESYKRYKEAGADRYLLRHETADEEHYGLLHPKSLKLAERKQCLWNLKELGYQVGTGFMVGSPYQTPECIARDLTFIKELEPAMVGIGPFLPHHDTPFKDFSKGSYELTLRLIAIIRLMIPNGLIPATTALGTIHPKGREEGISWGANVVMPNLSPVRVRKQYELYDNKICTGDEAAECRACLQRRMLTVGHEIVTAKGDFIPHTFETVEGKEDICTM
jgi:biotin synthase